MSAARRRQKSAGSDDAIILRGVRHNNLKGFDLDLPRGELIVVTGLSGSGKSSLAFDTLFAEGQRRYIETFSPYARQFFDRMDKPQVDRIEGIPPAIAIEQRNSVKTTRSTVGTMTEICEHMKAVWPHVSQLICPGCGERVLGETSVDVWKRASKHDGSALITFDLPLSEKLSIDESLDLIVKQGFQRILAADDSGASKALRIDEPGAAEALAGVRSVVVIQDRVRLQTSNRSRFIESCEQAYHFGKGRLTVRLEESGEVLPFSKHLHCARCDIEFRDPTPALFSFNHPLGACPACRGFGRIITTDYRRAIPDGRLSLAEGAVKPWQTGHGIRSQKDMMKFVGKRGVPVDVPFNELSEEQRRWVIEGDLDYGKDAKHRWPKAWYGVKGYFDWLESKAYKMHVRVMLSRYRAYRLCPDCGGTRLQPEALNYRLESAGGCTLPQFYAMPISRSHALLRDLQSARKSDSKNPVGIALREVVQRLGFLDEIGLGYLTLDRPMRSLSGGETERVSLTSCLGSRMVNTLYVLDEPSVGLHPRDTDRLIGILKSLRDLGNTVVVVEHEASVMAAADRIVDLGPGHGEAGGDLVFNGTFKQVLRDQQSLTGAYLSGREQFEARDPRPVKLSGHPCVKITNARRNNLKIDELPIPLGRFVCITGVSGSGKSTLLRDVLLPLLGDRVVSQSSSPSSTDKDDDDDDASDIVDGDSVMTIDGLGHVEKAVLVDQSILGKTPRSNPAVYTGAFDSIRELFARTDEAKERDMKASAFSFNSAQGQCEQCRGTGYEKIEMQFLSDVFIKCPDCDGRRYRGHVLEVKLTSGSTSWSVADVLDATVDEVVAFLGGLEESARREKAIKALGLLQEVGLGYLKLGQPVNTLSGGESQRLKLVRHMAEFESKAAGTSKALFLFDEPTTGLHFHDVRQLLKLFHRIVDAGHSLIVVEHNLDFIRSADWLIDLGPDAGDAGGEVVAEGTPDQIGKCKSSATGWALISIKPTT